MVKFLKHEMNRKAIKEVVRGKNLCCAVAFWGQGSVKELFGTKILRRSDVRIICDLSMGGTSDKALIAMGAPDSEQIAHFSGLHSKVYLSDSGLVVTSANASNNGMGFDNKNAKLAEAGIFESNRSKLWRDAKEWFENIWQSSHWVNENDIERARKQYSSKPQIGKKQFTEGNTRPSMLYMIKENPDAFGDIKFIIANEDYSDEEKEIVADNAVKQGIDISEYKVGFFSNYKYKKIDNWPLRFICLFRTHKKVNVLLYRKGFIVEDTHVAFREYFSGNTFSDIRRIMKNSFYDNGIDNKNLDEIWKNHIYELLDARTLSDMI